MLIRAAEVSSAELSYVVSRSARNLLGQTSLGAFIRAHDVQLGLSYLAVHEGDYVGVALVARRRSKVHLSLLAVCNEWRSQGVGRRLLDEVIAQTRPFPLELDVLSRNRRAIALYTSTGFVLRNSSWFWYRSLPLRLDGLKINQVRPVAPEIALHLTETPSLPWASQQSSLKRKLRNLRGAVYIENGQTKGVALFRAGLKTIAVERLQAEDSTVTQAMLRYMCMVSPAASALSLRWVQPGELNDTLKIMGLRCYSEYLTFVYKPKGGASDS